MAGQDTVIIGCNYCGARNRVPASRIRERPVCGRCKKPLSLDNRFPEYPITISDQTFQKEVTNFPGPVVIFFWAPWCGYCPSLVPVVDQLASEYAGRIKFGKLTIDQNPLTSSRYNVMSVPAFILFKRGQELDRLVGAMPKQEIERRLQRLL